MSGFSEVTLSQKLAELNHTQPSIQGLSLWLLHHRKHYQSIVKVWYKELGNVKTEKKLAFMYLANDLVQNSRKKSPEISKEFGLIMKAVFSHLAAVKFESKTFLSLDRLVKIWRERQIFDKNVFSDIATVWDISKLLPEGDADTTEPPPPKKKKVTEENGCNKKTVDVEETSAKILKMLEVLSSAADRDASCELLSTIPDLSTIGDDQMTAEELKGKVSEMSEAQNQLEEQTKILEEEVETRTSLDALLTDYIVAHRKLITKKKERLKNCTTKLQTLEDAKCYVQAQLKLDSIVDEELESIPLPDCK